MSGWMTYASPCGSRYSLCSMESLWVLCEASVEKPSNLWFCAHYRISFFTNILKSNTRFSICLEIFQGRQHAINNFLHFSHWWNNDECFQRVSLTTWGLLLKAPFTFSSSFPLASNTPRAHVSFSPLLLFL